MEIQRYIEKNEIWFNFFLMDSLQFRLDHFRNGATSTASLLLCYNLHDKINLMYI